MPEVATAVKPALKTKFISHATIEAADLNASKEFFQEFLGFEVIWMSPHALCLRLGGKNAIVCVRTANRASMTLANHNGVDVASREDVDTAYERCKAEAEKWGLHKITPPKDQHGNYSFYFWDRVYNCWEILHNPPGGYSDLFDNPKD
jgi:catechol 2,3-dioxygenase-like lactoylglutathione lyase family enzyme